MKLHPQPESKVLITTMSKQNAKRGGSRKRSGRKRLADLGMEKRDRKVLASFTPSEFEKLDAEADEEGVTVSELVAQKAIGAR
jgi:hypothetical protein